MNRIRWTARAWIACLPVLLAVWAGPAAAESWWTKETVEEEREVAPGIEYRRILYYTLRNEPVRAHIVNATGLEDRYVFGVLGSFGAHFQPPEFAKRSNALVTVNGGFFSTRPSRGLGMIVAHGRVLYPPSNSKFLGTVGFHSKGLLIDWIGPDEVEGHRLASDKPLWNQCHAALGAGPVLLKSGQIRIDPESEDPFYVNRHPRTGIGKTGGGEALLIVVDGRQMEWSVGINLGEFAHLFRERGAVDALNLDGGGSSAMALGADVVNRPSDFNMPGSPGIARAVANVIALFEKD